MLLILFIIFIILLQASEMCDQFKKFNVTFMLHKSLEIFSLAHTYVVRTLSNYCLKGQESYRHSKIDQGMGSNLSESKKRKIGRGRRDECMLNFNSDLFKCSKSVSMNSLLFKLFYSQPPCLNPTIPNKTQLYESLFYRTSKHFKAASVYLYHQKKVNKRIIKQKCVHQ